MHDRTDPQARVMSRVTIEDRGYVTPCWVSNRALHTNGYTKIGYLGSTWLTHRYAYVAFVGEIPEGMQLDHLCRVRACCNPDHLEPVTARENLLRGDTPNARGAAQTHCIHGHELAGDNLYIRPANGGRSCRTCSREAAARRARVA